MAQRVKANTEENADGRNGDKRRANEIEKSAAPKLLLETESPESRCWWGRSDRDIRRRTRFSGNPIQSIERAVNQGLIRHIPAPLSRADSLSTPEGGWRGDEDSCRHFA